MEHRLAASGILAAWETGVMRRPLDRAMAILWAAGAHENGDPADLPIAERDRLLLSIRADAFGPTLPARTACPDCGTELEMELDVNSLCEILPPANAGDGTLRPLTSRDLAAVCGVSPDKLASALRARLSVRQVVGAEAEALDRRIAEEASAAELTIRITCSECGAHWSETLDVATHVWAEIEAAALGLLSEVSELAAAFGWSQRDILSLSPARRMIYLTHARRV
ncbi:hypothetical protein [Billgrantia montanilacus]|uniref:Phage baseplate protein n=1 Tax=Billgrantia montanilacus TaxID=2282305 RepID=A0A368U226_9GAMM|nr:hypothetical protein [Halomonas montanilacus]RCV89163.1 hypothetical protein DU505_11440 [Halomonas montanilacus]